MDRKHFPEFYRKNVTRVYRFLFYRLGGNKEMAEDLTQDVFIKALDAFERYDPAISETSWILTIARNHLINQIQKQKPSVDLEEIENSVWDRVDLLDKMATRIDEQALMKAIDALPEEDAKIVRLKYLEGWPYEDIAKELGKTPVALRVQAHRALKVLRNSLKQLKIAPV